MSLRQDFNPLKFWDQCRTIALRYKKTEEDAEDFASYALERVLKYEHFQPMNWLLSGFFKDRESFSELKDVGQYQDPVESMDVFNSEDHVIDILFNFKGSEKNRKKVHHLHTQLMAIKSSKIQTMIESLEPLNL